MQADSSEPPTRELRLGGGAVAAQEMVPAGARARVLVLSALAALPAGAGPAGLPKQPAQAPRGDRRTRGPAAPPGTMRATSRALVVARERRLTTDYAQLAKLVAGDAAASLLRLLLGDRR